MEIRPSIGAATVTVTSSPAEVRNWQVGQLLNAVALSGSERGQVTLRAGAATLSAQMPLTVKAGQVFTLQVISLGNQPVLQLLTETPQTDLYQAILRNALPRQGTLPPLLATLAAAASSSGRNVALPNPVLQLVRALFNGFSNHSDAASAKGLKQAVDDSGLFLEARLSRQAGTNTSTPVQTDFKAGLLRLQNLLRETNTAANPPSRGATTPAPANATAATTANPTAAATARAAAALLSATAELQAARAIAASGRSTPPPPTTTASSPTPSTASTEARQAPPMMPPLHETVPQPQARVAALLQLLDSPARLMANLLSQVDAALARLNLNQLASQKSDGAPRQVWLLEVPIRRDPGVDVFHFRIERDQTGAKQQAEPERRWNIDLAFDLDGLGPVCARVGVVGEQVATTFWAEHGHTTELFRQHLDQLQDRLRAAGLTVTTLSCKDGSPPTAAAPRAHGVVDERA